MAKSSIIGQPFKVSINQRAVTAYFVHWKYVSADGTDKYDSCLLLMCACNDSNGKHHRLSVKMLYIAATSSHESLSGEKKHPHRESMHCSHWHLSRTTAVDYNLEPTELTSGSEVNNFETSTPGGFILSDSGINLETTIQQTMKELELSTATICYDIDLPRNKLSKLTFETNADACVFTETIDSMVKDECPSHAFEHNQQNWMPSSGTKQRRCSDKTGLVITVPRTYDKSIKRAGQNKKRKGDDDFSWTGLAPGSGAESAQAALTQTMSLGAGAAAAGATAEGKGFHFILPKDIGFLSDYLCLLFAQVKRGVACEYDLTKSNRLSSTLDVGFQGMRCRHCGGNDKGSYFPRNHKNLQACTSTLHTHLIKCEKTPTSVVRALKTTKSAHKFQSSSNPPGIQSAFFSELWERIQDESFHGVNGSEMLINKIVEQSAFKSMEETVLPNVVSYDEYTDHQELIPNSASNVARRDRGTDPSLVASCPRFDGDDGEDFDIALDLLRRAPTPNSTKFLLDEAPFIDITPAPVNQVDFESPIATKIYSSGERYHDGPFVLSSCPDRNIDRCISKKNAAKRIKRGHEDISKTRKFTRSAEICLVKGMMQHGTKSWKKIYEEQPGLHHIKQTALKDYARSHRFKTILKRAERDPSLLKRPDDLCGSPDQSNFHYADELPTRPLLSEELDADEMFYDPLPTFTLESETVDAMKGQQDLASEFDGYCN